MRVLRRSSGWNRRVEQVPLMEPHRKALTTGCSCGPQKAASPSAARGLGLLQAGGGSVPSPFTEGKSERGHQPHRPLRLGERQVLAVASSS